MRIIFAGTPEFAVTPLKALLASDHQVVGVYTQPDRPAGRGRKLKASPVKEVALDANIPIFQPLNFREVADKDALAALNADLMVVVAYGLLLPQAVLDIPRLGCINIHASLLPRWRGAAPIQRAIEAGDSVTGIGIMQMEAGLDTGPVWLTKQLAITKQITAAALHDQLALLGADALMEALPLIEARSVEPTIQDETQVTYAHKLTKAEAKIDWQEAAEFIYRKVRAFHPFPGSFTYLDGKRLKILAASVSTAPKSLETSSVVGQIIQATPEGIQVLTGEGCLVIHQLQLEGKKAVNAAAFIQSKELVGTCLGKED